MYLGWHLSESLKFWLNIKQMEPPSNCNIYMHKV